ncbi:MAG: hypothetical protein Q9165_007466 [Trypethelium subeluteriae]
MPTSLDSTVAAPVIINGLQVIVLVTATEEIYLEDKAYANHCERDFEAHISNKDTDLISFNLLNSLLVSGTSSSPEHSGPVHVPTTQQLSLAATLVVHPSQTTRAAPAEANRAANEALRLLRQVNTIIGPVNANFATAFAFPSLSHGRLRTWKNSTNASDTLPSNLNDGDINTEIANTGSVWHRAEDFWQVVGWALNCSVAWKMRWQRWELWLDFMLTALSDDFDQRLEQAKQAENGHDAQDLLKESLILQNLLSCNNRAARRRFMRAIFADGDVRSLNEFKEVFKNETKDRKSKETNTVDRKAKKLNIDEGEFADYIDDEDEDDEVNEGGDVQSSSDRPTTTTDAGNRAFSTAIGSKSHELEWSGNEAINGLDRLGGMASILHRQRLLALLSKVAETTPAYFVTLEDLLDLFTEFIRPLPTPLLSMFVSPPSPYLSNHVQTSLNRTLLRPLLGLSDSGVDTTQLDQAQLENDYLPWKANSTTVSDNAKVSLLVEGLLRGLLSRGDLHLTMTLQRAVEWGVEARRTCMDWDGRKRTAERRQEEEWSEMVLEMSAARINAILDALNDGEI